MSFIWEMVLFVETIPFHLSGSGKYCQKGKENTKYIWIWWDANSEKVDSIFLTRTWIFLSFWFARSAFKDEYHTKREMILVKKLLWNCWQFIRNFEKRERLTILALINMQKNEMWVDLLMQVFQRCHPVWLMTGRNVLRYAV